jgi:two-component system, OmpR family, alkaline phosphatase synthesis response regulator PhoP
MKNGHHVLVVEDEQHLAVGIKYNLEAEGYRVTHVGDGPAALELLKNAEGSIDLVILDLMLPEMSGYKVCEQLRSLGWDLPVLILSARTLAEDRTRGFAVGADQYLTKPFDLEELLTRVRSLLVMHHRRIGRRMAGSEHSEAVFEFSNAKINFETYEVDVGGEPAKLTPLEMKLLQYFVSNEGRVIPRDELLENVWKMPGTINTRAVDQFIRRLRKTFEPDPASPRHFLTIRDVGYRFVAAGIPLEHQNGGHGDRDADHT